MSKLNPPLESLIFLPQEGAKSGCKLSHLGRRSGARFSKEILCVLTTASPNSSEIDGTSDSQTSETSFGRLFALGGIAFGCLNSIASTESRMNHAIADARARTKAVNSISVYRVRLFMLIAS